MNRKTGSAALVQGRVLAALFLLVLLTSFSTAGLPQERTLTVESFRNNPLIIEPMSNLQSEHWLRDLKIKVTNRSSKAIYYVNVGIAFPDIAGLPEEEHSPAYGDKYSFTLWWGQARLVHKRIATANDDSIRPGESHILTVPEEKLRAFETYISQKGVPHSATRNVLAVVWVVGFGDGTGFKDGEPFR